MSDNVFAHRRRFQGVLRAATAVWLAASGVQFVIWLLIGILGGNLVAPWWLWTVGAGGVLVSGGWLAGHAHREAR